MKIDLCSLPVEGGKHIQPHKGTKKLKGEIGVILANDPLKCLDYYILAQSDAFQLLLDDRISD